MSKHLITLSEYNRIYQVAHGTLREIAKSEKACIFFNCFGAMILNEHYKIPARAVAGGFALCLNDKPEIAFFGHDTGERIASSADGFHMWVQTETHIIDFMAPIFPEAFADAPRKLPIPRKMLQKPKASEASRLDKLMASGDFFTLPDIKLTETLIDRFLNREQNADLLMISNTWFGGPHKKQKKTFTMQDSLGEFFELSLPSSTAMGSW